MAAPASKGTETGPRTVARRTSAAARSRRSRSTMVASIVSGPGAAHRRRTAVPATSDARS